MIGCTVFALMMFVASAWAYTHRTGFVIKGDTVPIHMYESLLTLRLFLGIQLTFWIGISYFCIGFTLWKAYRKYRLLKR